MAHIATAEQILRKSLEKVAHEHKYSDPEIKVSAVSTEGANYTSFLFEATISSKGKDDINLFSKVAAVGEKMRTEAPMRVFDNETIFYTKLAKEYTDLEERHGVPEELRFKAPKIYAVNSTLYEETFVMDNLSAKGYMLYDRFKSIDWPYAASSFTELAKLHALSMTLKHEKPEEFKKYAEELKFQFDMNSNSKMKVFMEQGMQKTLQIIREENKGKLMAYLGQVMAGGGLESFAKFFLPGENPVIRHGDYRPSNLMYKVKKDGSVDIVVVDFQTLVPGTLIVDLLYFIFLGTDKAFRDKYYDQLIDHYYKELSAALSRLGMDPEKTYSRQNFYDELKENLIYGLVAALMTLPLVTVDVADAPEVTGEHDLSSFAKMQMSSICANRMNEVLDDYIKWGIL